MQEAQAAIKAEEDAAEERETKEKKGGSNLLKEIFGAVVDSVARTATYQLTRSLHGNLMK